MRRLAVLSALLLALLGLVACGDDGSEDVTTTTEAADDSVPEQPETFDPPDDDEDDDPADPTTEGVLADVLAATEQAGGGSFELVDDVDGDGLVSTGTFTQDPVAFEVSFPESDAGSGGSLVVVDDTVFSQFGDEDWQESGDADTDSDVLLDIGPLPARMLEALLALDEPIELDPEIGELFQWTSTGEQLGVNSDYGEAPATVDVAVEDGVVVSMTVDVEAVSDTLDGGTLSMTFTYEDVPPITAPEDVVAGG
jgi:hypothetical protein